MRVLVLVVTLIVAFVVSTTQPTSARQESDSGSELALQAQQAQPPQTRTPDVIFVPTREPVRRAMLKLANVTKDDLVIDLGCGAGDIVVTAAKEFGARAHRRRHRSACGSRKPTKTSRRTTSRTR